MKTEFVQIPSGTFTMGATDGPHSEDGEGPVRQVELDAYLIAATTVSNLEFAAFITATGYKTSAEKAGGSQVFQGQLTNPDIHSVISPITPWWRWVVGANWRAPDGRQDAEDDLPVVHVSLLDAIAYCDWAGVSLPTEAQWEQAASFSSGSDPHIFTGHFPDRPATNPRPKSVREAKPNTIGLYHACGNVWEWTNDRFTRLHSPRPTKNPSGPLNGDKYVVKGGSFLCAPSYCARYRPSSRRGEVPTATAGNLGFRTANF